jgi:hypothetical protein
MSEKLTTDCNRNNDKRLGWRNAW